MSGRSGWPGAALLGLGMVMVAAAAGSAPGGRFPQRPVSVTTHVLPDFLIGHPEETRFGQLAYVGGFEIEADTRAASGLSGLVIRENGAALTAITDRGLMLVANIVRDGNGTPTGLNSVMLRGIEGEDRQVLRGAREPDAEGFGTTGTKPGDLAFVSMEAIPRILVGAFEAGGFIRPMRALDIPAEFKQLRRTKGLEALAVGPPGGPLAGRLVVFAERPRRGAPTGNRPGWLLADNGSLLAAFHLSDDGFDVTDAAFGPDGDLYVLERLFTLSTGAAMRVRRIDPAAIVDGAIVEGTELVRADLASQIDNMEGMSLWPNADGRMMLSLVSDDNSSFMQRALYLEFAVEP